MAGRSCARCGRETLLVILVPGASRSVRAGLRPDNPLRCRGIAECLLRGSCPFYVEREARRRARAAARRPGLRRAVFERDRGVCVDCGEVHAWDADHALALADGGRHELGNVVTRCRVDHRSKTAQEHRLRSRRYRDGAPAPPYGGGVGSVANSVADDGEEASQAGAQGADAIAFVFGR